MKAIYTFEDLAVVDYKGKFGYIDMNGKEVIKPTYTNAFSFKDGIALATKDNSWYLVNRPGERLNTNYRLPTKGPMVNMGNKIVAIKSDGCYCCTDIMAGRTIKICEYAGHFSQGLTPVLDEGEWYYIGIDGRSADIGMFEEAEEFNAYGHAIVKKGGKKFLIDTYGHVMTPTADEIWNSTSEGWVTMMKDSKYGYYNIESGITLHTEYDDCYAFSGGHAPVEIDDRWIVVDESGGYNLIPDCNPSEIFKYFDGIAKVEIDNRYSFIDSEFRFVLPNEYEDALFYGGGFIPVKQNGYWSFIEVTPQ